MEVTKLPGIGSVSAKQWSKKGINHVEQFLDIPPPFIAEMLGITNDAAGQLATKAMKLCRKTSKKSMFRTAGELAQDNEEQITTGTRALDKVLEGGLKTGATTEVYGEFGSGKTQFCYTMAVRVQLPVERGGLDGKCVVIDTEGTFTSSRLISIAKALDLDPDTVLENVIIARAHNSVDQKNILMEIQNMILDEEKGDKKIKLLIVDSAIGLFRQDFSGRAQLSERQKYLDQFLTLSSNMANNHKLATVWTNQVMTDPGTMFGDPTKPVGGTVLAHKSTYRVYFQKSGAQRIAKMVDSSRSMQTECNFGVGESGLIDSDEAKKQSDAYKAQVKIERKEGQKYKKTVVEEPVEEPTVGTE